MNKFNGRLNRWSGMQLSLAGRIMVINHFLLASVVFFLACWRPPDSHLEQINRICARFLWSGDFLSRKMHKVKWKVCVLPKDKGGLGILNIQALADKLARKWVIRALDHPCDPWPYLFLRKANKFELKEHKGWKGLPMVTLLFSPFQSMAKGSSLVQSVWSCWNKSRPFIKRKEFSTKSAGMSRFDCPWWPVLPIPPLSGPEIKIAKKIFNKGVATWNDLWDRNMGRWKDDHILLREFSLLPWELNLIQRRLVAFPEEILWHMGVKDPVLVDGFTWSNGSPLTSPLSITPDVTPPLHTVLNKRWGLHLDRKQWNHKFGNLWKSNQSPRKSVFLWLLLHRAIWTGAKSFDKGLGSGICCRCKREIETEFHLFINCSCNSKFAAIMQKATGFVPSWKQWILGDYARLPSKVWNCIRGEFLWAIWKERNSCFFSSPPPLFKEFVAECSVQAMDLRQQILSAVNDRSKKMVDLAQHDREVDTLREKSDYIMFFDNSRETVNFLNRLSEELDRVASCLN